MKGDGLKRRGGGRGRGNYERGVIYNMFSPQGGHQGNI